MAKKNETIFKIIGGGVAALFVLSGVKSLFNSQSSQAVVSVNESNLSFDRDQYALMADTIYVYLYGGNWIPNFWEWDADTAVELIKMNTVDDVKALIRAYGIRAPKLYQKVNLQTAISFYLDKKYKEAVNLDYREKGIKFQW